jgi:hypothetical protein
MTDSVEIISILIALDADLAGWVTTLPVTWTWACQDSPADPNTYEGYYHIYPNFWTATMWNNYRAVRILVNELLLIHLNRISSPCPYGYMADLPGHHAQARAVLLQLTSDICASTPYYLGNVSTPYCKAGSNPRSLGGFQVMWPLFVCGSMTWASRPLRDWVIRQLNTIGYAMGVQQALPLADLLKRDGNLLEWSRGENDNSWENCLVPEKGLWSV